MDEGGRTGFWRVASGWARPWLLLLGKALVTVALFTLVLRAVDMQQVWLRLQSVSFLYIVPLLAVMIGQVLITTARWRMVMAGLDVAIGFPKAFMILLIGIFFNQSLPSTIGGDVVRIWRVHREGYGLGRSVNVVLVDRVMALVGILVLVVPALPVLHAMAQPLGATPWCCR